MKFRGFMVFVAMLVAGPTFAQKIYIDYDRDYDGSGIKTFAWAETADTSVKNTDPMLHDRIVGAIEERIKASGVQEVDSDPDVYVTYHGSSKEELSVDTTHYGYGVSAGWGYGRYGGYGGYYGRYYGGVYSGYGTSSTTVSSYQVGTLVIDIWDAKTENIIWRGIAANITITENPQKMGKKVDKVMSKMISKWERMKRKAN